MTQRCSRFCEGRHLVVAQDASSFNLAAHYRRLKADSGLGPIEDNYHLGFFLHASLVIDLFSDTPLGFSDVQLWHRTYDDPERERKIRTLPLEQKESYKWLRACQYTKERFSAAASITFVQDRDGDIYDQFALVPDHRAHLVIRSCKQRRLEGGGLLFSALGRAKTAGTYTLEVGREPRVKRKGRTATIEVRYKKLLIKRPRDNCKKHLAAAVEVFGVEAKEINYRGKDKIHWRLLTTREVGTVEQALEVIALYKRRWHIEQLFRLLKKQGFGLEESELESGWAIRRLAVLALGASLCIMQLMYTSEGPNAQPLNEVFTPIEQACLRDVAEQLKGATAKLSNPYQPKTTPWAKWIIARLGGWNGYTSQRPAGPITLKRGLDKFTQIFVGWCLALKYCEDVYTP